MKQATCDMAPTCNEPAVRVRVWDERSMQIFRMTNPRPAPKTPSCDRHSRNLKTGEVLPGTWEEIEEQS